MGVVYLARDVQLDRDVAIKVLPTHLAELASARERFLREARMAAGLSHPHIVPIHRVGEAGGFVFFVMSYVEGESLGERLRNSGPLPPEAASRMLREVAWALAYAHGRGIIHRDVKPDNILIESATGRALVTDFGIAQGDDDPEDGTEVRRVLGTRHFMSPEQALGDPLDGRSDLYALGVVGHLAVTGRLPSDSATSNAPGVPAALVSAIDQCLSPDPDDRFPDGEALAAALAPTTLTRPGLPPGLRAWLGTKNPLQAPYLAWSSVFGMMTLVNFVLWVTNNRPKGPLDIVLLLGIVLLPVFPTIGFHLKQAHRQFRAGHSLGDLRSALEVARREREEEEALVREGTEPPMHRVLRAATIGSLTWLGMTFLLAITNVVHESRLGPVLILAPIGATLLSGAISNVLEVQFIPDKLRSWWATGLRDRLWNSRLGAWFARRLGAPERSRAVEGGVFRPTEVALGVAASELYAALPSAFRDQLGEVPAMVTSLEARAAEARAEIDMLAAMAPDGPEADALAARRTAAKERLAETVAALEGIRLDLLRLHANAGDLAPLTTLIDAARRIGEDVDRLAEGRREAEKAAG